MSTVTELQPTARRVSLIEAMAEKHHMEPKLFADTIRKTVMPGTATTEEFAAFMMVAQRYNLDPLLREIHAFPKRGGGIMPVVSIDGWVSLINQHPAMNGIEFTMHHNDKQQLVACTCRIYRKDRDRPVEVTEYFVECYRATEPWKMQHRMLRHKAMIQAARYAFGFSGIYDQDEAERTAEVKEVTPSPEISKATLDHFAASPAMDATDIVDQQTGEIEPSAADAYEQGRQDRDAGKAMKDIPPHWREPGQEKFADAWQEGWLVRADEELKKS